MGGGWLLILQLQQYLQTCPFLISLRATTLTREMIERLFNLDHHYHHHLYEFSIIKMPFVDCIHKLVKFCRISFLFEKFFLLRQKRRFLLIKYNFHHVIRKNVWEKCRKTRWKERSSISKILCDKIIIIFHAMQNRTFVMDLCTDNLTANIWNKSFGLIDTQIPGDD